jgi:ribosomal protein S16
VKLEKEKIEKWIKNGAIPSDSVASLLKSNGFSNMDKYLLPRNKQKKSKKEKAAEPAPVAA